MNQVNRPSGFSLLVLWQMCAPWIATLGVGRIPFAPGTWGSLLGLLIWWAIKPAGWQMASVYIALASLLAVLATSTYEKQLQHHDPKEVVIDEVVGMWITFALVPLTPATLATGFVLFRALDILKPFPIRWVDQKVPGAWGTLLDDVVAGLFAGYLLYWMRSNQWLI